MSTTFTVPLRDFKRIAELALRCVGTDSLLPVVNFVEFRSSGGVLMATATDRYTIARARVEVEDLPDVTFYLHAKAVRLILATFKARRGMPAHLTIDSVKDGKTTVAGKVADNGRASLTLDGLPGEWPQLEHLVTPPDEPEAVEFPIFDPNFLGRIPTGHDSVAMTRKGYVHGFYTDWWVIVIMAKHPGGDPHALLKGWAA